ncbi:MAG: hypothetical protein ACKOCD_10345 [Nitrospiraceae bacterium]
MSSGENKIAMAVKKIEDVFQVCRSRITSSNLTADPVRARILTVLIFGEIEEIMTILRMLDESRDRACLLNEELQTLQKQLPSGTVDISMEIGHNFNVVAISYFEETARLKIHIKTLYEWLYHLKELLDGDHAIRQLVSPEHWSRLEAYGEVRGALIAHKTKFAGYVMSGVRYSKNLEKIELTLNAWNLSDGVAKELDVLFGQCAEVLSIEERQEANFYERCRILSTKQHALKGNERARVVAFIRKYGTFLEDPSEMAEFAAQLVEDLIPKLSATQVMDKK